MCETDAERAGRDPCVMCVNATRPVNTAPAWRRGSAPAMRAGGGSSVTKVSPLVVPPSLSHLGLKEHWKQEACGYREGS